jgi:multicomponent K+:H+ antiporter subunit E
VAVLAVRRFQARLGPQVRPARDARGQRLTAPLRRTWALLRWLGRLVVDIVLANFRIAALVLWRPRPLRPLFVELPLRLESPLGLYLMAASISLTPGTLTVDLCRRRRCLLVHAIDASEVTAPGDTAPDPQRWAAAMRARYEDPLLEVFR